MIKVSRIEDGYKRNGCNICKIATVHLKRKGQNFCCNCGKFLHKNEVTIALPAGSREPASSRVSETPPTPGKIDRSHSATSAALDR